MNPGDVGSDTPRSKDNSDIDDYNHERHDNSDNSDNDQPNIVYNDNNPEDVEPDVAEDHLSSARHENISYVNSGSIKVVPSNVHSTATKSNSNQEGQQSELLYTSRAVRSLGQCTIRNTSLMEITNFDQNRVRMAGQRAGRVTSFTEHGCDIIPAERDDIISITDGMARLSHNVANENCFSNDGRNTIGNIHDPHSFSDDGVHENPRVPEASNTADTYTTTETQGALKNTTGTESLDQENCKYVGHGAIKKTTATKDANKINNSDASFVSRSTRRRKKEKNKGSDPGKGKRNLSYRDNTSEDMGCDYTDNTSNLYDARRNFDTPDSPEKFPSKLLSINTEGPTVSGSRGSLSYRLPGPLESQSPRTKISRDYCAPGSSSTSRQSIIPYGSPGTTGTPEGSGILDPSGISGSSNAPRYVDALGLSDTPGSSAILTYSDISGYSDIPETSCIPGSSSYSPTPCPNNYSVSSFSCYGYKKQILSGAPGDSSSFHEPSLTGLNSLTSTDRDGSGFSEPQCSSKCGISNMLDVGLKKPSEFGINNTQKYLLPIGHGQHIDLAELVDTNGRPMDRTDLELALLRYLIFTKRYIPGSRFENDPLLNGQSFNPSARGLPTNTETILNPGSEPVTNTPSNDIARLETAGYRQELSTDFGPNAALNIHRHPKPNGDLVYARSHAVLHEPADGRGNTNSPGVLQNPEHHPRSDYVPNLDLEQYMNDNNSIIPNHGFERRPGMNEYIPSSEYELIQTLEISKNEYGCGRGRGRRESRRDKYDHERGHF